MVNFMKKERSFRQAVNTGEADLEVLVIRSLVGPPEKSLMEIMGKMW
jgi:hypothetical protein